MANIGDKKTMYGRWFVFNGTGFVPVEVYARHGYADGETVRTVKELEMMINLIPEEMELDYPQRITYGNTVSKRINCRLTPAGVRKNVLFLGDENSVSVRPDGEIFVKKTGTSIIHCLPVENTAIYETIQIQVVEPDLRVVDSNSLRLMANGHFRLT
jgi:hypothetical protein